MLTLSLPSASYAWKEHENNQNQIFLTLPFSFEICLVITVAPLGIVCSCSTLRTRWSSALSIYDKQKFAWQTSPSSFLGLHLGLKLDDHCRRKKSISTEKCSVDLELICISLPTYPNNSNFFQLNQCEISNVANHLSYLIFEFFDCIGVQSNYDIVMTTTTEIASDLHRKAETLESKTLPCI